MAARELLATEQESVNQPDSMVIAGAIARITTSGSPGSGTDANVCIVVGNRNKALDTPNYNDFEKGDDDMYSMYPLVVDDTLGTLRRNYLEISHDDYGSASDWKVDRIKLFLLPQGWPAGGRWLVYKEWNRIGWLRGDEDGRTVVLQRRP